MSIGLGNLAPLLAAMDLHLVQRLTAGMRDVNRRSLEGMGNCPGASPDAAITPRPVIHPTPRIEARTVHHPEPRIEPRKVIHPAPRIETPPAMPVEPPAPAKEAGPIQPPWRKLVWETPAPLPPRNVIKPIVRHVDNVRKGSMLDLFI